MQQRKQQKNAITTLTHSLQLYIQSQRKRYIFFGINLSPIKTGSTQQARHVLQTAES
jgi:hypothetical protein